MRNSGGPSNDYEAIIERLHKVMSFAQLVFAGDQGDPERGRFLQTMQERYNAIYADLLFFTLEINRMEDDPLEAKLSDPVAEALSAVAPRHPGVQARTNSPTNSRSCFTTRR